MPAHAEEANQLYGLTQADDHSSQSYSWQFDYRQNLFRYSALSVGYVNEGHAAGRFVWSRSLTNDDQDRDIVTLGVGFLW